VDRSVGMLRIVLEALFLSSSGIRPTLLSQRERLPRMGTTHRKHTSGIRGLAREEYMSYVLGFPL
jgi:hypothetical protein